MTPSTNTQPLHFAEFEAEIQEMQSALLAATSDLISPLGELVRAQIKRANPPLRGAVVLAVAGAKLDRLQAGAGDESRRKRILLAAALEMLYVALNVHRLLVNAAMTEQNSDAPLDRSFVGSTILAGDYCFSRAAQMAAQTDHPQVVAIFALALQTVSEGLLRKQFNRGNDQVRPLSVEADGDYNARVYNQQEYFSGDYDETHALIYSGAEAAATLIALPEAEKQQAIALSQELFIRWTEEAISLAADDNPFIDDWMPTLPNRWQALYHWLAHQESDDFISRTTPDQLN
jgi:geranylgeranyl pyrophosphate synthase